MAAACWATLLPQVALLRRFALAGMARILLMRQRLPAQYAGASRRFCLAGEEKL